MSKLKKCKECGANNFMINEFISYKASIDKETGILQAYTIKANEIESIICRNCEEEYIEADFDNIQLDY